MTGTASAVEVLGRQVTLPVEVRSAQSAAATFVVREDAVRALMEPVGLEPASFPGGRSLAILAAVDYLDNDLGAYHEVGLCFPVKARDGVPGGAYIHRLPVDGEFTCAAGRGIWGFPKWVAQIDLSFADDGVRCRLVDDGELVLDLRVRRRRLPLPARRSTMTAWSHDGQLLRRTAFSAAPTGVRTGFGGAEIEVGHRHPMACELRALGLPKRALASTVVGNLVATFEAPVTVA